MRFAIDCDQISYEIGNGDIDDLSKLSFLDEDNIIAELRARYKKGQIYTYIGDVLIAINPFKQLNIYEKQHHEFYSNVKIRKYLNPHIFWVADHAYQRLLALKTQQCIAVSGESGAGKTESTKLIVQHIIQLCKNDNIYDKDLQKKILEVNNLLEAFGNAQTCMNSNSSRFGKYLQLSFTEDGKIIGAKVYDYLLEKSRVVQHGPGERNYHIFYYLFAGLDREELEYYYLDNPETYRILQSNLESIYTSKSELKYCKMMFQTQKEIMKRVGFLDDDISLVFTLLAAILHLTNIKFLQDEETDGVYIDDEYPLEVVASLLALDQEILATSLISNYSITRGERVVCLKNRDQANDCRDALAKALYERLFGWIVRHINNLLQPHPFYKDHLDQYPSIGILDMSGFENFQLNSFEQLCINVANEHLQFYFNEHIFLQEEEEYFLEGIQFNTINFQNNEDLIELFMGPLGIFALLDEESKFPKATDTSLVNKFHSHCKSHVRYLKPRGNDVSFGINHYAGKVVYDAKGFLEKNRDNLSSNLIDCMKKSNIELVAELFAAVRTESGSISRSSSNILARPLIPSRPKSCDLKRTPRESLTHKKAKSLRKRIQTLKMNTMKSDKWNQITVASHFRNSLAELLDKMKDAEPLFVRCLKPNHEKASNKFDEELVTEQLRYNGIVEISHIRNQGWPMRMYFEDFLKRYKVLSFPLSRDIKSNAKNCELIIKEHGIYDYAIGRNKVFLKMWHPEILNQQLDKLTQRVIICQKIVRGFICRKRLVHLLALVKQQTNERIAFINQINKQGLFALEKMIFLKSTPTIQQSQQQQHHQNSLSALKSNDLNSIDLNNDTTTNMILPSSTNGSKVDKLRIKLEEQMKTYAKQEEYEEMIKLIKKYNLISNDNLTEIETEIDKIENNSEVDEYESSIGFITDDEIAILASGIETPIEQQEQLQKIETNKQTITKKSNDFRQSTPLNNKPNYRQTNNNTNEKEELIIDALPRHNYAKKRSILRKLMIAQRKKFQFKKEQIVNQRDKNNLAETSYSNFSQCSSENEKNHDKNIKTLYDVWDTARVTDNEETYEERVHFFHLSLQILKVATYVVLSLTLLLCAILSKGTFLLMTNAIGHVESHPYRERWVWMLLVTICAPYLYTFFESIFKALFGNKAWPTVKIVILLMIVEGLHSFGLSILVFRVLPKLDVARAILMMNAVCTIPGILKLFLSKNDSSVLKRFLILIFDIVAVLMQLSVFGIVFASKYVFNKANTNTASDSISPVIDFIATTEGYYDAFDDANRFKRNLVNDTLGLIKKRSDGMDDDYADLFTTSSLDSLTNKISNLTDSFNIEEIISSFQIEWELPIALILVSICWWENFIDRDIKLGSFKIADMKLLKENIVATRCKSNIFTSAWKIALTILFAYIFYPGIFNVKVFMTPEDPGNDRFQYMMNNPALGGMNGFGGMGGFMMPGGGAGAGGGMLLPPPPPVPVFKRSVQNKTEFFAKQEYSPFTAAAQIQLPSMNQPGFNNRPPIDETQQPNLSRQEITFKDQWMTYIGPMILQLICSILCYYMSRLACKLCMQRIGFALPLTLVTPISLTVALILCKWFPDAAVFKDSFVYWTCHEGYETGSFKWQIFCGLGLWWISQLWIGGHIWFGKGQRLAFTERLFVLSGYCGILIEQSLMMNRRRSEKSDSYSVLENNDSDTQSHDSLDSSESKLRKDINIIIYSCATLWHETEAEMLQLLKSIMRLDIDQSARRKAQEYFGIKDPDYYEYEGHIFFDDCMEEDDDGEMVPNQFVRILVSVMDQAATCVHETPMKIEPPIKIPTPYGGQLKWTLPGGNLLIAHLKDKTKIRHKKRWSQVMYIYYLVGYKIFGDLDMMEKLYKKKYGKKDSSKTKSKTFKGFGNLLNNMDDKSRIRAENTFVLALDGDVDFRPEAVRLLVDRMKKNKKVGAACGRIHPIGSGPMVWYQKFEYAIGHWLQKATEHILGCVMCSPGCFSLFRGSSLVDDHVLHTYLMKSSEARHYVQFDQGEDRWLCTLLLQEGYRVEYCAASDALTNAPETFHEFYNQRRRWVPSTIANIMDFLADYKHIVTVNESISNLYILYQFFLMVSTVLGPATVVLMITGAYNACIGTSLWQSFLLAVGPPFVYLLLCYITTTDFQIRVAAFLSAIYAIVMMAVIVGTTIQIAEDSWTSPNAVFLMLLLTIFIIAAVIHPQEFWCIVSGALYFLCIPSGYLFLMIYSLCNLNIVSWGTREVEKKKSKKKTKEEDEKAKLEAKKVEAAKKKNSKGFFSQFTVKVFNPTKYSDSIRAFFRDWLGIESNKTNNIILKQILGTLERIEKIKNDEEIEGVDLGFISKEDVQERNERLYQSQRRKNPQLTIGEGLVKPGSVLRNRGRQSVLSKAESEPVYIKQRNELINPAWMEHECLDDSEIRFLEPKETVFFQKLIERFLYPLVEDKGYQAKVARDLKSLRNNACFAFFMINALWMVIIFHLQLVQYKVRDYIYVPIPRLNYEPLRFEPLGFSFLIFFASILLVQFFAMLWHRYGTVLHLLASTDLKFCQRKFNINQMEVEDVVQTVKVLQQIKGFEEEDLPVPDYDDETKKKLGAHPSNRLGNAESNNTLARNLDILSAESKIYDGASVYSPLEGGDGQTGGASSMHTYNSNYYQSSKHKLNKKNSYNKSLDVVFRRRWHALSQGKGNQIKQKPRVKVNDIFLHQVSSNIQQMHKQSKQSLHHNSSNDHIINIEDS